MKLLLDAHLLVWASLEISRVPQAALAFMGNPANELIFSSASLWELAIKSTRNKSDFQIDARVFQRRLLDSGYFELPVFGRHAVAVASLPLLHRDPLDRLLIAQAIEEGIVLLTADRLVAQYPGPIRLVW